VRHYCQPILFEFQKETQIQLATLGTTLRAHLVALQRTPQLDPNAFNLTGKNAENVIQPKNYKFNLNIQVECDHTKRLLGGLNVALGPAAFPLIGHVNGPSLKFHAPIHGRYALL
jgi:hypothetical protein